MAEIVTVLEDGKHLTRILSKTCVCSDHPLYEGDGKKLNSTQLRRPGAIWSGFALRGRGIQQVSVRGGNNLLWSKHYKIPQDSVPHTVPIRPDWPMYGLEHHDVILHIVHSGAPLTVKEKWKTRSEETVWAEPPMSTVSANHTQLIRIRDGMIGGLWCNTEKRNTGIGQR